MRNGIGEDELGLRGLGEQLGYFLNEILQSLDKFGQVDKANWDNLEGNSSTLTCFCRRPQPGYFTDPDLDLSEQYCPTFYKGKVKCENSTQDI